MRTRNRWGWGFDDAVVTADEARAAAPAMRALLGFGDLEPVEPVPLDRVRLVPPRVAAPNGRLAAVCDAGAEARTGHAYGRSYLDVVRGLAGRYDVVPDLVARPRDERDVTDLLEWAEDGGVAVIPYGGGTSVVGGVEARVPAGYGGAMTLDLGRLDRVLEVDEVSGAARIAAGASGPRLEEQLRPHGLTMRFFPQSFECSTLGGWIATRAGGHFATGPTHVDDLVESVRAVTPRGPWESRRLPGSGAGPSPDRLLLGSEGILGVITEAWVRVRRRPVHRARRAVRFPSFAAGAEAVRAVVQAGLTPANLRLLDPLEAGQTGAGDGHHAVLVVGVESADAPVEADLSTVLAVSADHGGRWDEPRGPARAGAAADEAWRSAFLRMPYLRDMLVRLGVLSDTFETAVTWAGFPGLLADVTASVTAALGEPCRVSCRLTHVYPDGPAPYFTVLAPVDRADPDGQWWSMKRAAGEAILRSGGTITHHHAVGRDHRDWYDRQRPDPFAAALRGAKSALDPGGILNPGVLIDP